MRNFLIVSEIRCGYQLLSSSLNTNPNILCFGEIFGSVKKVRARSRFGNSVPVINDKDNAVEYVEKKLIPYAVKSGKKALGFKLNYLCCRYNDNWKGLWDYIQEQDWAVIHLYRENYLNRLLSERLAVTQDCWNHQEYYKISPSVKITRKDIDFYYNRSKEWQMSAREKFKNNTDYLELSYEQLTRKRDETFKYVQEFLGVNPKKLRVIMKKQRTGKQEDYILDYSNLRKSCLDHPVYSKWFDIIPLV